jgi:hypothetical protein
MRIVAAELSRSCHAESLMWALILVEVGFLLQSRSRKRRSRIKDNMSPSATVGEDLKRFS